MAILKSHVDSLMGLETFMWTKGFESLQKLREKVWFQ